MGFLAYLLVWESRQKINDRKEKASHYTKAKKHSLVLMLWRKPESYEHLAECPGQKTQPFSLHVRFSRVKTLRIFSCCLAESLVAWVATLKSKPCLEFCSIRQLKKPMNVLKHLQALIKESTTVNRTDKRIQSKLCPKPLPFTHTHTHTPLSKFVLQQSSEPATLRIFPKRYLDFEVLRSPSSTYRQIPLSNYCGTWRGNSNFSDHNVPQPPSASTPSVSRRKLYPAAAIP